MSKILEVNNLEIDFNTYAGTVHAIRNVSFHLDKGETLAIVGESGSGKSVTLRTIMGLLAKNGEVKNGEILFNGQDILKKSEKELNAMRGNDISMIFQDPMTSLDPTMPIGKQVAEVLRIHGSISKKSALDEAARVLELVGIKDAKARLKDYPHQFSGGQRQRIVIAIAIINNPQILIADEPTTALDVTIQAQILNLLKELQTKIDTSIIFITHDLGVVAGIADRVAVMYAGKIIEYGTVDEIFYNAQHPYTWGLLESMPTLETNSDRLHAIPGTPPSLINPPVGDAFAARNAYAMKIDTEQEPPFFKVSDTHYAATWLLHPEAPAVEFPPEIARRREVWKKMNPQLAGKDPEAQAPAPEAKAAASSTEKEAD
ncbi:ABC transporter ATP-binding protein [Lacticaseibacillus songhuajiangensis]|uniref:ABC transporter ATP-binding protein n=1 Tax=Lacticaseibacillus songhuajiangensis TaxID=1296539 RepID=UPI000F788E60|nr:ABC transporter ATP-binding protein [Lacticaseibacillus songhuajiangensis]